VVFYFNAWASDHHEDPLQSILFSLINEFYSAPKWADKVSKLTKNTVKTMVNGSLKALTKDIIDIEKIMEIETIDDLVAQITSVNERKEAISKIVNEILPEGKKLLIIIDELDRCNPSFAVKVMEVMKHYYNDDKIVFVLSTNNRQLVHTIKKFYGQDFDGFAYLDKFYDLVFSLPPADIDNYLTRQLKIPEDGYYVNILPRAIAKYLNMSMREINRYFSTLGLIKGTLNAGGGIQQSVAFALTNYVFIPYALALRIKNITLYDEFLAGGAEALVRDLGANVQEVKSIAQKNIGDNKDPIDVLAQVYSKVIKYERLSHDQNNYHLIEAGQRFRDIVPLMNVTSQIDPDDKQQIE
jgi:hypothetical protein